MMFVTAKVLNGARRLMTVYSAGTSNLTERISGSRNLGLFCLRYGCSLCMVGQRGRPMSSLIHSSSRYTLHARSLAPRARAQFISLRSAARCASSRSLPIVNRGTTREFHLSSEKCSEKKTPSGVPQEPDKVLQQPPQACDSKSLPGLSPTAKRSDGTPGKGVSNSEAEFSGEGKVPALSLGKAIKATRDSSTSSGASSPKTPASSTKKTKKKPPETNQKAKKQTKKRSVVPTQAKKTAAKSQAKTSKKDKAETATQRKETGNPRTDSSSSITLEKAKTTSATPISNVSARTTEGTAVHQGSVTGNRSSTSNIVPPESKSSQSANPPPNVPHKTGMEDLLKTGTDMSHHLSGSVANSRIAGQPPGPRSNRNSSLKSGQVTPPSRTSGHESSVASAIDSKSPTIPSESRNISSSKLDRGQKEVVSANKISAPLDKTLSSDGGVKPSDDLTEDATRLKSKSNKKEKRHNWAIVKTPQAYLQPFMDVSIFCGMVQEAQALFNSAREHGQGLDSCHYNTMLQAWARKGDLTKVRSLFSQMAESRVKRDVQSYAAALECMARMKGTDHDMVVKCLEEMESENLSPGDIFHFCIFTNDSREVILRLIQSVRPGFEAPPPLPRPQCQLEIVQDLYCNGNSTPKSDVTSDPEIMEPEEILSGIGEQMRMEKKETIQVSSIEQEKVLSNHTRNKRAILQEHRQIWRKALQTSLDYEIKKLRKKNPTRATLGKLNFYPFLSILKRDEYVELMLEALHTLAASTEGSMTVSLSRELGNKVQRKFLVRRKIKTGISDKMMKVYKEYASRSIGVSAVNHRDLWQILEDEHPEGPTLNADIHGWPAMITLGLGSLLADVLIREIKIDANMANSKEKSRKMIPALYYMYTYRSFKQVGYVKPHPSLVELLQQAKEPQMPFESNLLPMISPPIPWTSVKFGAYPLSTTKIMRCRDGTPQHQSLLERSKSAELSPILDSLNQLAAVPWIINKQVLDVIISVFRNGGSEELDVAQPPSILPTIQKPIGETTPEDLAKIQQQRAALRKRQAEMHSLRMDMLYKLSIADKYRDEVIWFPHNMDFRGRVYPCPPHLNHMGSDVTRSVLLFAKGLPLGKNGLDWIKIHLVNLTGHKKRCSLAERLAYANEMMPEIVDSAENPLEGYGWWTTAEEKWQALACCMEINNVLNYHGDPSTYVSHLPVHQDGSCNGLQHYAALGRDIIGAHQVNLCNTDIPQDVYSGVAQMVEAICQKDAENDVALAKVLQGQIHRKVVKQTVMTVVYGVTMYGGKLQILKQLKDVNDIYPDDRPQAASYLVHKVFQSLRKMFTKTREIQDWLTDCAWLISKAGETVQWVTPLGLPVVQPYHKKNLRVINHSNHLMYHEDRSDTAERPDSMKQKNAFPPNFIHSLDSTHMMLTSLHCHNAGINFASVHDCFWTHASTIPTMNRICREQFVRLHSEEVLQNLAEFMLDKYGHLEVPMCKLKKNNPQLMTIGDFIAQVPLKGDFDLNNVLKSTFFFS